MQSVHVPLVNGGVAIVDLEDFAWLSRSAWRRADRGATSYAVRVGTTAYMHRSIIAAGVDDVVDHVNRDGLDNRRANLRIAAKQGNSANRGIQANNTSGFRGVRKQTLASTWTAEIKVNGQRLYLGSFPTATDAARAYDIAARDAFGEFAFQNLSHCQRPEMCAASGLKHCHSCEKAIPVAESEAA